MSRTHSKGSSGIGKGIKKIFSSPSRSREFDYGEYIPQECLQDDEGGFKVNNDKRIKKKRKRK